MSTRQRTAIVDVYAQSLMAAQWVADDPMAALRLSVQLMDTQRAISGAPELREHLTDSALPLDVRLRLLDQLFGSLPVELLAVLRQLVERQELRLLERIEERLIKLIEEHFRMIIIDVTTVVPLDNALRQTIQEKYSVQLGSSILLREHIDPAIMGGIVMQMHGRRIDASLNAQLARARTVLVSDTFGGE